MVTLKLSIADVSHTSAVGDEERKDRTKKDRAWYKTPTRLKINILENLHSNKKNIK